MLSNHLYRTSVILSVGFIFSLSPCLSAASSDPVPSSMDLRPNFKQWGLTTRLQGTRNTCSVFTIVGALEYALARQQDQTPSPLSVEYLNWASNQAAQDHSDGSYFSDLWRGFTRYGICTDSDLPYRDTFDAGLIPSDEIQTRARQSLDSNLKFHWIKKWNPDTGLTESQLTAIKTTINLRWPVCGGFRWPRSPIWKDNTLQMTTPDKVFDGHSVLLVGYRDDPDQPGGGLFIFRNSNNHGRDGLMPYAFANAYMNDAAWIDSPSYNDKLTSAPTLNDILGPFNLFPKGRNRRVSSNQQPGWHSENLDMDWLMPGQSVNMPLLEGPGVITHIWFTSHSGWVDELHSLSLRIYYDGSDQPGVEVPVGDFFAVGQGKPAEVNSIPVQVSPTGSLTCFWRIPFRQQARIVVTNDNPDRSTGLYWQVDWTQLNELPAETPYFYAHYRQEYPAAAGNDYLLADLKGSGFYVGTVMSITMAQDGWFGEGDDFFYIDGETTPSLQGTGTEDYFNDAWGYRVRTAPWFGQPRWQGYAAGDSCVCYRWHQPDPVCFSQSLKVAIEHRGNLDASEDGFFLERPDFISSVAFWYQTGQPQTTFPPLPTWPERRVPWQYHHLVKTYRFAQSTGPAKVQVQTQGFFGARPLLLWPNHEPSAQLTLPFELAEAGSFNIRLTAARGPDYGRYDLAIDDKKLTTANFHDPDESEADIVLGTHTLEKGPHTLTFTASGNADLVGPLAVELLRLLSPAPAGSTHRTYPPRGPFHPTRDRPCALRLSTRIRYPPRLTRNPRRKRLHVSPLPQG